MRLTSRTWICAAFAIVAFGAAGAGGLVVNGEFDTDLLGWDNVGAGKVWSPFDDTDDPSSGSISISNTLGIVSGQYVEQCVPVEGGLGYHFSYSHYSTGTNTTGRADVGLYWFSNALCNTSSIGHTPVNSLTTGVWTAVATDLSAPPEALALLVRIQAWKNTGIAGDPWTVYYDHIQLAPEPAVTSGSVAALGALASVARRRRVRRARLRNGAHGMAWHGMACVAKRVAAYPLRMTNQAPLRFGILGAARIAPMALIRPARSVAEAQVVAVAARDGAKARAFANKHGIPRVHDSYDALLADPELDAIYNPLPNGLHCEWTIKALRAGKHVLCEKPIASNAAEAQQMADAARETGRVLVEAFHWRYHPLATRVKEILASGAIGAPRHYEAALAFPIGLMRNDIRWRWDLAGGAMMDAGCYTVSMVRHMAEAEPEVVGANALSWSPQVDRRMEARYRFADGRSAATLCSMWSRTLLKMSLRIEGERGEVRVFNPIAPHFYNRVTLRTPAGTSSERVAGEATYTCQLRAFVEHVRNGTPVPTGPDDAIANMRVIDAVYRAAGLKVRGTRELG